ncbi:UDP-2,4-diacetamido-2,4,6-trideoxy-beta-L-altropyranose hydrolase [Pseudogemmobacter sp. W21_MBD1_M6]|uniref:UDP-2,4-diacetamido-2,4, 6-trideoxy-beta-L-altropyranose hydrolase n=1 Tax=Pseudogemmobacter sp. W21_MBD1_M6 TaxID=3240271 RepID=UPI003F970D1B
MIQGATICFRCDASVEIGTGHVMRCLTLADAVRQAGAHCHFLCRDLPGNLIDAISARGFRVHILPSSGADEVTPTGDLAHAAWLGVSWQTDASECAGILTQLQPDWLIVDHYALDARWEKAVLPDGARLMVIDDLADRAHICDLLLDQNLGRKAADYDGLVPAHCIRLIGPAYALLRPEFAWAREASLARRNDARLDHILVSMGGIDKDDATSQVLAALAASPLPQACRITVVMGRNAPWLDRVRQVARSMPRPTGVVVEVADMASLMASADLAIGGAGGTSWERCCLGLPSLLLVLADNQAPAARAMEDAKAAVLLGDIRADGWQDRLCDAIARLSSPVGLEPLTRASIELVDGRGALKACRNIMVPAIFARRATAQDAERIFDWRTAGDAARYYRNAGTPKFPDHLAWLTAALTDERRILLILQTEDAPVAHVRFDRLKDDHDAASVGICISPDWRGKGLGPSILCAALSYARGEGISRFDAEVHLANSASLKLFERCGFEMLSQDTDFRRYGLTR